MDRETVESLTALARRRVPASEVEDIVQSALAEAVASTEAPEDPGALRRWLAGVVRHKVADFHRRRHREVSLDQSPEMLPAEPAVHHEERDLLRWARRQLPTSDNSDAQQTLDWMMHEADGEKLESIAAREQIPATRVRQRVVRLRAFFRERWHRELVLASVILVAIAIGFGLLRRREAPPIAEDPSRPTLPHREADRLRAEADGACARASYRECLDKLDQARALDPAGDAAEPAIRTRRQAERGLLPPPVAPAPTTSTFAPAPLAPPSAMPSAVPAFPKAAPTSTSAPAPAQPSKPRKPSTSKETSTPEKLQMDALGRSDLGASGAR